MATPIDDTCPAWCELPAGHAWQQLTSSQAGGPGLGRQHVCVLPRYADILGDRALVNLFAQETINGDGSHLAAPYVQLWTGVGAVMLTTAGVRALAGALLDTADQLDGVS